MADRDVVLIWADGREEKVWASLRVEGDVLVVSEHYGVTGGTKSQRMIPLVQLREWRIDG